MQNIKGSRFYYKLYEKKDGRNLHLFGRKEHSLAVTNELDAVDTQDPHLRWHPMLQQWVGYATGRQNRTFHPPKNHCPLCPVEEGGFPAEVPFADFEVAVFDNRFPSFSLDAQDVPNLGIETKPSNGKCEVIVYSPVHDGNLGQMDNSIRELLVQAWTHRYINLYQEDSIEYVMPFENRGKEVGVTLPHPHGQIYAFNYLPPNIKVMAKAFAKENVLLDLYKTTKEENNIWSDDNFVAWVPPVARFPFETWLMPNKQISGPWDMSDSDFASLADGIGQCIRKLDGLFQQKMPYIMALYAAPKGFSGQWHFHIQFLPFMRDVGKLKYLAGVEVAAGSFLVDMEPSYMAQRLREVE